MIDVRGLKLEFGSSSGQAKIIFNNVSCRISDNARVGIVGPNGAGKTTLLRVLIGEAETDGGAIEKSKGLTLGYLPQDLVELDPVPVMELLKNHVGLSGLEEKLRVVESQLSEHTSESALRSRGLTELLDEHVRLTRRFEQLGGWDFESMALKVLNGLGFKKGDAEKNCAEFSGGWKMRIAMAALLLSAPDVLLLDEPTNHLDTESMEWLEGWLRVHKGAVVAVSHDRRFLENMAEQIFDLDHGVLKIYPCGYDQYLIEKQLSHERLVKSAEAQQREIKRVEAFIDRFRYKATKATQVQSRIKRLSKINVIQVDQDDADRRRVHFRIPEAPASGLEVLKAVNLSKHYGELDVFDDLNFTITRGEKVALVGVNGAGKSTLLRLLSETEAPTSGTAKLGYNVKIAFYSQESAQNLNYSRTVWEEAYATPSKLNDVERRTLLGTFLFSGSDIEKSISVLSGGEKARLALFKLMLAETNFLVLDEPTNHLDPATRDIVQQALLQYEGTLLIVSHDRSFLDNLAERVLEIRAGKIYDYPGNYSWFLEKREQTLAREREEKDQTQLAGARARESRDSREALREAKEVHREIIRALKKQLAPIESRIEKLEARQGEIDAALCDQAVLTDSARVQSLMVERSDLTAELDKSYASWEDLSSKLEAAQRDLDRVGAR